MLHRDPGRDKAAASAGGLEALHRRVGPRLGFLENVEVLRAAEVVRRGLRREEDLGG